MKVDLAEELVALEKAIEAKAAYDTAKAAVEKAVESGEKKDIEKAEELIEALADEKQRKELEGMLEEATPAESEQPKMGVFNLGLMGERDDSEDFEKNSYLDLTGAEFNEENLFNLEDEFRLTVEWKLDDGHD